MKKQIKIFFIATSLLLLGGISNVHAQWLTAGNGLTGGTPSTPNEWIGSNNPYDFIIKTNNTQRMRVLSAGHVLIGTGTAAAYPLTLNDYTNAGTLSSGGNFAVSLHSIVGGAAIGGQDTGNNNAVFGATGSTSDILFATYNGTNFDERVRIKSAGNVGIGTTSPDIFGAGSAYRTLSILGPNTSAASCGVLELATKSTDAAGNIVGIVNFVASENASTKQSIAQIFTFTEGSTATNRGGVLTFLTKQDAVTTAAERMRITSIGNIGVGTTSPTSSINSAHKFIDIYGVTKAGYVAHSSASAQETSLITNGLGAYFDLAGHATASNNFFAFRTSNINSSFSMTDRMRITSAGNVGIGFTAPTYKLEVNGTTQCTGNIWTSDQQFKTNVDSVNNALAIIKQLKPKSYYFDTTNVYGFNFQSQKQHGFIAQDVEQILPELVFTATKHEDVDSSGNVVHPAVIYKSLSYIAFIPILTKGIQELQQKNDSLQSKANHGDSINTSLQNQANQLVENNTSLQNQVNELVANGTLMQNQLNQLLTTINNCCSTTRSMQIDLIDAQSQSSIQQMDVELNDVQSVILEQNIPNPFQEQTIINYTLPDNTAKAQMLFYNSQGKIIQSVELVQKGKGQLNVFASDLTNGVYTYTLVVDGKIIDTKRMVKQ